MKQSLTLNSYEDWRRCITVLCGIPLTSSYIQQRLAALRDPADSTTKRFVAIWGEHHRLRVIHWFEQAQRDVGTSNTGATPPPSGQAT